MVSARTTAALFAGELLFTALKALALVSKKKNQRRCAVPCFVVESALGIALSLLLLISVFCVAGELYQVKIFAVIIFITELMSVTSEAINVRRKVLDRCKDLSGRQRWRRLLVLVAFLLGLGVVAAFLFLYRPTHSRNVYYSYRERLYVHFGRMLLLSIILLLGLCSFVLGREYHVRMTASIVFILIGAVASAILSFCFPQGIHSRLTGTFLMVVLGEGTGTVFVAIGSALTSVAFWALPDIGDDGLHIAHVCAVEVAAFSVVPPSVLGLLGKRPRDQNPAQRQVLLVVLPQVAALVVPLLFSYFSFLYKASTHAASDDSKADYPVSRETSLGEGE